MSVRGEQGSIEKLVVCVAKAQLDLDTLGGIGELQVTKDNGKLTLSSQRGKIARFAVNAPQFELALDLVENGELTIQELQVEKDGMKITGSGAITIVREVISEEVKEKPEIADRVERIWRMSIMHHNDSHGHLENVARLAAKVKEIRTEEPSALLVQAGDVFTGTLYFTQWQGQADLAFMNGLNYDLMTLGNHEFDKDSQMLADFISKAKLPILNANFDFSRDAKLGPLVKGE